MRDPDPGRPQSLGREADLADAEAVLTIAGASRLVLRRGRPRGGPGHVVREALWDLWERPRLPPPLVGGKYPTGYPWSPAAQQRYVTNGGRPTAGGWGLIFEHLYPREYLVRDLLESVDLGDVDAGVALLTARLMAAVVAKEDDHLLPLRSECPRAWENYASDPWLRYRSREIPLERFRRVGWPPPPLEGRRRSAGGRG